MDIFRRVFHGRVLIMEKEKVLGASLIGGFWSVEADPADGALYIRRTPPTIPTMGGMVCGSTSRTQQRHHCRGSQG